MSGATSDLLQSFAYTKTVSKPVNRKTHQTQFPETPFVLTISVTKFGVSVEKVVATIDKPNSHQGSVLPERKYSDVFLDDLLETANPIVRTSTKKNTIIILSITLNSITNLNLKLFFF